jgi:hypothetical protein
MFMINADNFFVAPEHTLSAVARGFYILAPCQLSNGAWRCFVHRALFKRCVAAFVTRSAHSVVLTL